MNLSKISIRYGTALFDLAVENKTVDRVNDDMVLLSDVAKANRDFVNMLRNPVIGVEHKARAIQAIFAGKVSELTSRFLNLMVKKGREKYLPEIAESYIQLFKESKNIKTAYVSSAAPLTPAQKEEVVGLLKKITPNKIEIVSVADQELIGGFVVRLDNYLIDQSVKTKIRELQKTLGKNLYIKGF